MANENQGGVLAALNALLRGAAQGATLGLADEAFGSQGFIDARAEMPLAYSLGEGVGAFVPSVILGKNLPGPMMRALSPVMGARGAGVATGAGLGAAHGAAAGFGGVTPGDLSLEERLTEMAALGLIGGAVGGGGVAGTKAGLDLYDNMPALTGRRMTENGPVRAAPGQGTRRSAPMSVHLRGEGSADERAQRALMAALGLDEFEAARGKGGGQLNRYGAADGKVAPFDVDARSTRALVDYGAQSPAGSRQLNSEADSIVADANRSFVKGAKMPKAGRTRAKLEDGKLQGFVAAFGRPEYHESWVREAKRLPPNQRLKLAQALMADLKTGADGGPGSAEAARARLTDPQVNEKLAALGVKLTSRTRKALMSPAQESQVAALRGRASTARAPDFANVEDRMLASRAALTEADALALLRAARQPQDAFFPRPRNPTDTRLLEGRYEQGARFNPGGWLDATPEELKLAVLLSQPAAAFLHGAPTWFEGQPEEPAPIDPRTLIAAR